MKAEKMKYDPEQRNRGNDSLPPDSDAFQQQLQGLFASSPIGIFRTTPEGKLLLANPAMASLLDYDSPEELIAHVNQSNIAEALFADPGKRQELIAPALETGEWVRFTTEYIAKSGRRVIGSVHIRSVQGDDGELELEGFFGDISQRTEAESQRDTHRRNLAQHNQIAQILLTTEDAQMFHAVVQELTRSFNSRFGYFGYINAEGDLVCPSMTEDIWEKCQVPEKDVIFPQSAWGGLWGQSLKEKSSLISNSDLNTPEGHVPLKNAMCAALVHHDELVGQLVLANAPDGYSDEDLQLLMGIADYIAPVLHARLEKDRQEHEREILARQLRQAQKLEAIGTLAGGIAHDFNNILFAIMGYGQMLIDDLEPGSTSHNYATEIMQGGRRAKTLIGQILSFARETDPEPIPLQISSVVKETLHLMRASLPANIEIHQNLRARNTMVYSDPTQLHQVVMNICTNAGQAMTKTGGHIHVTLEEASAGEDELQEIILTIADTGPGIPPAIQHRVFEPFFTTKDKNEGTGLGLSVVHGIVMDLGGRIHLKSELGRGTTFIIHLPVADNTGAAVEPPLDKLPGGSEHIMVVDDESPITRMLGGILNQLGYEVTTFTDPEHALSAFQLDPDHYDLVITDQTMPHLLGDDLARKMLALRPGLPVILHTGYTNTIDEQGAAALGIRAFLAKPISKPELARTVRDLLDAG
jgi:PAS domain S-box-containing protein